MQLFVAILYSHVEKANSSLKFLREANALMNASWVRSSTCSLSWTIRKMKLKIASWYLSISFR